MHCDQRQDRIERPVEEGDEVPGERAGGGRGYTLGIQLEQKSNFKS